MNRTMAYESHLEQIVDLRNEAYDASTLARAFDDLADEVKGLPTKGAISDIAVDELAKVARQRADLCRATAVEKRLTADRMEKDGLP